MYQAAVSAKKNFGDEIHDLIAGLRQCRLCWRITGAIFVAILATEAAILFFSVNRFEADRLYEVEREGLVIARAIIRGSKVNKNLASDIAVIGPRLRQNTALLGLRVYDMSGSLVGQFGALPDLPAPGADAVSETLYKRFDDGTMADVMWPSQRTRTPFVVAARIDTSEIPPQVNAFIWRIVGLVVLISTVVTLVAMLVLERLLLRPIRGLRDGLSAIAQNPKTPPVGGLPDYGTDELREVTKKFDFLISRLYESFDQIERQNKALMEKEIAEEASRAKSEFMASMSHELRTPLNAILGFSDMISNQYLGPIGQERYLQYAEDIALSGRHLLNLVDQILHLERIDAGKYVLVRENINISELLDECRNVVQKQATDKQITLSFDIQEQLATLNLDRCATFKILNNLINNAVKFTPDHGEVKVRITQSGQHHIFEVSDTGVGISREKLVKIKEPFTRHDSDPHRSQAGVGLGLAVVSSLIEVHRGQLEFTSEPGTGTTIVMKLPREPE